MTETPNLHLTKDAQTEPYNVDRVNANSDRIDEFAGTIVEVIRNLSAVATSGAYSDLTGKPVIDDDLDKDSTNAVQNRVVQAAIAGIITALMTAGKTLGANSDLNEEKDAGHFQCAATNANSCKNRPLDQITGGFGGFNVPLFGERLLQFVAYNTITGQATGRLFMRFLYSSGWTLWKEFGLTEIPAPESAQSVGGDASA